MLVLTSYNEATIMQNIYKYIQVLFKACLNHRAQRRFSFSVHVHHLEATLETSNTLLHKLLHRRQLNSSLQIKIYVKANILSEPVTNQPPQPCEENTPHKTDWKWEEMLILKEGNMNDSDGSRCI